MKKKTLKIFSLLSIVALLSLGLQSFVTDGDDDPDSKKQPNGKSCTYQCWYKDNKGVSYSIPHAGTRTECDDTGSGCTSVDCAPLSPC